MATAALPDFDPRTGIDEFASVDTSDEDLFGFEPEAPEWSGKKTVIKLAYPMLRGEDGVNRILGLGDSITLNAEFDKKKGRFFAGPDMIHANDLLDGGYIMGSSQAAARAARDIEVAGKRGVSREKQPELLPMRTASQVRNRTVTYGLEGKTEEALRREHGESKGAIRELVDLLSGNLPHAGAEGPLSAPVKAPA